MKFENEQTKHSNILSIYSSFRKHKWQRPEIYSLEKQEMSSCVPQNWESVVPKLREPFQEPQSLKTPRSERHSEGSCPHPLRPGSWSFLPSLPGTTSSGWSPAVPVPPPWRPQPHPWMSPPPTKNTHNLNLTPSGHWKRGSPKKVGRISRKLLWLWAICRFSSPSPFSPAKATHRFSSASPKVLLWERKFCILTSCSECCYKPAP